MTGREKIADGTGLGLHTVRSIIAKSKGTDRTTKRHAELRRRAVDRLRMAEWRARKRQITRRLSARLGAAAEASPAVSDIEERIEEAGTYSQHRQLSH